MNMELDFKGKAVIITGAASGMGLCASQKYAEAGAHVVMCDVNVEGLKTASEGITPQDGGSVEPYVIDMRDYAAVEKLAAHVKETYGHIDITASFAGGSAGRVCKEFKPFHELSIDAINWGVDVNLKAPMYLARAVLPIMLEQKSGVIINIGSITGVSAAYDAEYSAAKSGLIGFTKSIAIIGAPHGVRCCLVSPGGVMTRPGMAGFKCPMNRVAEPEEIINVVLFVSSDKASFVTGDNYLVDGGRACGAMA